MKQLELKNRQMKNPVGSRTHREQAMGIYTIAIAKGKTPDEAGDMVMSRCYPKITNEKTKNTYKNDLRNNLKRAFNNVIML